MVTLTDWMDSNLRVQGYGLDDADIRARRWGLRFSTALCLMLVVIGLATRSSAIVLALVPIGAVGGWTSRHSFDLLWNHGVRHLTAEPALPPNPPRRRHAFKVATGWLLVTGLLLAFEQTAAALILGAVLVGVCALVTTTNFCVPSTMLRMLDKVTNH